jgi:hypothetical protein
MNLEDKTNTSREAQEQHIKNTLCPSITTMVEDIKKAKRAQLGEIREWSGVKMRKEASGWVPVKEADKNIKQDEKDQQNASQTPESLADHAKNASESALVNATKQSTDPKVREAAHKELQRRKSEEAQETFKAPENADQSKDEGKKEEPKPPTTKLEGDDLSDSQYKAMLKQQGYDKDHIDMMMYSREKRLNENKESTEKPADTTQSKPEDKEKPTEKKEDDPLAGVDPEVLKQFRALSPEKKQSVLKTAMSMKETKKPEQLSKEAQDMLDKLDPDKRRRVLENALKQLEQEKKVESSKLSKSDKEAFDSVRDWVGDKYDDSMIASIVDQLKEGLSEKALKIRHADSQEQESQFINDKVRELSWEIRPGLNHKDLNKKGVHDILWGIVRAANNGMKFLGD